MSSLDGRIRRDAEAWRANVDDQISTGSDEGIALATQPASRIAVGAHARRKTLIAACIVAAVALAIGIVAISHREDGGRSLAGGSARRSATATGDSLSNSVQSPSDQATDGTSTPPGTHGHRVRQLTALPAGPDIRSLPWTLIARSDGGMRLVVSYEIGEPCWTALGFVVVENDSTVKLTAVSRAAADGKCAQSIVATTGIVTLRSPLGGRTLLHAAVSPGS
jgi:hypothetical protein